MSKHILIFILIIHSISVIGQEINDSIPEINLKTIASVNHGNSYLTFPTDIGNIEPLWFEGNMIPDFNIRVCENSRLMGVLTPQVIIRMYQEESLPVRTPSYIPHITIYYLLSSKTEVNSLSLFGKLAHHSNGQEGNFYLENGNINYKSGSFSTNFYELGIIKTNYNARYNAAQFFGSSVEIHPPLLTIDELKGIYSLYRWNTTFSIFKIPVIHNQFVAKKAIISIKGQTTYMFGNVNNWDAVSLDRLNLSLSLFYHPTFFEDIGLFVQIYHGSDYYNIYFDHQINVMRFGIMTEKLRF